MLGRRWKVLKSISSALLRRAARQTMAFNTALETLGKAAGAACEASRRRCRNSRRRLDRSRGQGTQGPCRRCAACHPRGSRRRHPAGWRRGVIEGGQGARHGPDRQLGPEDRYRYRAPGNRSAGTPDRGECRSGRLDHRRPAAREGRFRLRLERTDQCLWRLSSARG